MNITIKGTIQEIKDEQVIGNFKKREIWVKELEGQYPNTYAIEAQQAFTAEVDKLSLGDTVECQVDVRGRQWEKNGKAGCMNTLRVWRIEVKEKSQQVYGDVTQNGGGYTDKMPIEPLDDLPF